MRRISPSFCRPGFERLFWTSGDSELAVRLMRVVEEVAHEEDAAG